MTDNIIQKILHPTRRGKIWLAFIFIILLAFAAVLIDSGRRYNKGADWLAAKTNNIIQLPHTKEINFRLGLDLQGGTQLIYEADMSAVPVKDRMISLEGARDVIERRVNVFGVSEPNVQTNKSGDDYQIIVELAGIKDVKEAIKMIGETPLLEFKEQGAEKKELTPEQKKELEEFNKKAEAKATEILGKVISGGDFAALAREYSEDEQAKENGGDLGWITETSDAEMFFFAKQTGAGNTSRDLLSGSKGYEIIKVSEKRAKTDPFTNEEEKEVMAAHLLICYKDISGCESGLTKEEALDKIKKLKAQATPVNFRDLVKQNSTEPGARESGGELGWFGKEKMVKPFAEEAFRLAVGAFSDPVETEFGYHLIYKQDERVIEEYKVEHILIRIMREEDILGAQSEWKNTELTGKNLKRANVQFDPNSGNPEVSLEFDDEGAKMFTDITGRNVGKPVAIFLDGYPISVPTVNEKITGGRAVISGNFNIKEAKLLAQRLNAGALPVPISLINQQTIGASLGQQSVSDSLRAGVIGFLLVALFMVIFYRLPGLVAVASLAIYGLLVLAVFKIWPVTLTLAGLAGFIMSIGMAVDANILIFARFKEELKAGKPIAMALEEGFKRAWFSIRDSNVSTLITCFILIQFSTSIVKGFAVTLALGVLASMFTAIVVSRNLLNLVLGEWVEKRRWLMGGGNIKDKI